MAAPLMTEQKTRIVEWFLQTNPIVTVQRRFKNQYKCKETPRNTVKTSVEQFRATGNVTGEKRGGSKPRIRTPNTVRTICASVASSPHLPHIWVPLICSYWYGMVSEWKLHNSSSCNFLQFLPPRHKHYPQYPVLKHIFSLFLHLIGWVMKQNPQCFVNFFFQ